MWLFLAAFLLHPWGLIFVQGQGAGCPAFPAVGSGSYAVSVCLPKTGESAVPVNLTCADPAHHVVVWDYFVGRNTKALYCNYMYPAMTHCPFDVDIDKALQSNLVTLLGLNGQTAFHEVSINAVEKQCGDSTHGYMLFKYSCSAASAYKEHILDTHIVAGGACPELGVTAGYLLADPLALCASHSNETVVSMAQLTPTSVSPAWTHSAVYKTAAACTSASGDAADFCAVTLDDLKAAGCWNANISTGSGTGCTWTGVMLAAKCDTAVYKHPLIKVNSFCAEGPCPGYIVDVALDPEANADFSNDAKDCAGVGASQSGVVHPDPASLWTQSYLNCTGENQVNTAHTETCQAGQTFNPQDKACNSVNPCAGKSTGNYTIPGADLYSQPCYNQYLKCNGSGHPEIATCDIGFGFSASQAKCVPDNSSDCDNVCAGKSEGNYTHAGMDLSTAPCPMEYLHCTAFGNPVNQTCGSGTAFSPYLRKCVNENSTECDLDCKPQTDWNAPANLQCKKAEGARISGASFVRYLPITTGSNIFKVDLSDAKAGTFSINANGGSGGVYTVRFYTDLLGGRSQLPNVLLNGSEFKAYSEAGIFYIEVVISTLATWRAAFVPEESFFLATYSPLRVYPCSPSPCKNQGQCVIASDYKSTCNCQGTYGGDTCETEVCPPCVTAGTVFTISGAEGCQDPNHYYDTLTDTCYFLIDSFRRFDQATKGCDAVNSGKLAAVYNNHTLQVAVQLMAEENKNYRVWTGVQRDRTNRVIVGEWYYLNKAGVKTDVPTAFLDATWDKHYPKPGFGKDQAVLVKKGPETGRLRNSKTQSAYQNAVICSYAPDGGSTTDVWGLCKAAGDPHFTTFDKRRFDFQGECDYTLFSHQSFNFTVQQRNKKPTKKAGVSWVTGVFFNTPSTTVYFSDMGGVTVNGISEPLPVVNSQEQFCVRECQGAATISSKLGFQVSFTPKGNKVTVLALKNTITAGGAPGGLCGNFDGVKANDMESGNEFNYSSQFATSHNGLVCGAPEAAVDPKVACGDYAAANQTCYNNLPTSAGAACWANFTADEQNIFLADCALDVCNGGGDWDGADGVLSIIWNECSATQIYVPSSKQCGLNEEYSECASACEASCVQPDAADVCKDHECVPRCVCSVGFIRSGGGDCVPASSCGCQASWGDNTRYHELGTYFLGPNGCSEDMICKCEDGPRVACQSTGCHSQATCQPDKGACVCNQDYYGNGYSSCIQAFTCDLSKDRLNGCGLTIAGTTLTVIGIDSYLENGTLSSDVIMTSPCLAARITFSFVEFNNVEFSVTKTGQSEKYTFNQQTGFAAGFSVIVNDPFTLSVAPTSLNWVSVKVDILIQCLNNTSCVIEPPGCSNGATCTDDFVGNSCTCPSGFFGPTCNKSSDVCAGVNCNQGKCVNASDGSGGFVAECQCNPGWRGDTCTLGAGVTVICEQDTDSMFFAIDWDALADHSKPLVVGNGDSPACSVENNTDASAQYFWRNLNSTSCGVEQRVELEPVAGGEQRITYQYQVPNKTKRYLLIARIRFFAVYLVC